MLTESSSYISLILASPGELSWTISSNILSMPFNIINITFDYSLCVEISRSRVSLLHPEHYLSQIDILFKNPLCPLVFTPPYLKKLLHFPDCGLCCHVMLWIEASEVMKGDSISINCWDSTLLLLLLFLLFIYHVLDCTDLL